MPGFEYGVRRAFLEIISGLITSAVLIAFVRSGLLDPSYVLLFILLNLVAIISLILVMPYWGTTYLLGWMFALLILFRSGLIGALEFIVYFGVPLLILIKRITKSLEESYSVL